VKQIATVRGTLYALDESGEVWRLAQDDPGGPRWVRTSLPS
jgi:hypothetical protein